MSSRLEIKDKRFWAYVWDTLHSIAGASMGNFDSFIQLNGDFDEYRFQGKLGFGGKVWNANDKIYINYYPEDRNSERDQIEERVNKILENLLLGYYNGLMDE